MTKSSAARGAATDLWGDRLRDAEIGLLNRMPGDRLLARADAGNGAAPNYADAQNRPNNLDYLPYLGSIPTANRVLHLALRL